MGALARRALAAQSDERLVRLVREGQEPAFEEIVRRYRGSLTAFAAAFIPHHRAEDVVQNSLLKAHKALLVNDREIALRAWLFTIVRNGCLNAIRDEPAWQELDPSYDGVPQPPAIAERNEELQALVAAICALPEAQRRALVGRELEGQGHAELAAELDTTSTAIRGLIFRARLTLRDALGAMIPLPIVRTILASGSGGAAGKGAGIGIGVGVAGAGGGVSGIKVVAAVTATALVVGGGVAIERRASERHDDGQIAQASTDGPQRSADRTSQEVAPVARAGARTGRDERGGSSASGPGQESGGHNDSGGDSGSGGGPGGGGGSGGSGGHRGPGGGDDSGTGGESSGPGPGAGNHDDGGHEGPDGEIDDGGHSGPGGGEDLDDDPPELPELEEPDDDPVRTPDDESDSDDDPLPELGDDHHDDHSGPGA